MLKMVHGDAFNRYKEIGAQRLERIKRQLHERGVRLCGSNNSRLSRDMDLPCALDAPDRYHWFAYEFGSHHFDFLRAMYQLSNGRCGVVGIDGDPNMPAHLSVTFEEFYLYHLEKFRKCPPNVCCFAGNCASFSMQAVQHHGRSEEPVNGAPSTYECAQKIEFANETNLYIKLIMLAAWEANPNCKVLFETPKGYCTKQPIYKDVFLGIFRLKETRFCKCKCFGTKYRKEINIVNNMRYWPVNKKDVADRLCTSTSLCCFACKTGRHPKVVEGAESRGSARFGVAMAESLAEACLHEFRLVHWQELEKSVRL